MQHQFKKKKKTTSQQQKENEMKINSILIVKSPLHSFVRFSEQMERDKINVQPKLYVSKFLKDDVKEKRNKKKKKTLTT